MYNISPKLIKIGKGKQAPTPNPLATSLPSASLPTSFAVHILGEQRRVHVQPREGMRNMRMLAKLGHAQ